MTVVVRSDDSLAAEEQRRHRPGKPREEQAGGECLIHEADQCFNGDHDVGRHPVGTDLAVSNRGKRLDAEEECLSEPSAQHGRSGTHQRVWPARQIRDGESQIQHQIDRASGRRRRRDPQRCHGGREDDRELGDPRLALPASVGKCA